MPIFRSLTTILLLTNTLHAALPAAEEWGAESNGLRIGLICEQPDTTADQQPQFRVKLQNTSKEKLSIPEPTDYVEKPLPTRPDVKGFHTWPLAPEITPADRNSYYQTSGEPLAEAKANVTVLELAPGETRTVIIPLETRSWAQGSEHDYNGKTTRQIFYVLPESKCAVRFKFGNAMTKHEKTTLWTGQCLSNAVTVNVRPVPLDPYKIEAGFSVDKAEFVLGEPITIHFKATNRGSESVYFEYGGDYRGTGRPERFSLKATDEKGNPVPDPIPNPINMGGMGGTHELKPGETYKETLLANRWCAFTKGGSYKIQCQRTLNLHFKRDADTHLPEALCAAYPVTGELALMLSVDEAALKQHLAALAERLKLEKSDDAGKEMAALAHAHTPAALPFLKEIVLAAGHRYRSTAVWWLCDYGKEASGEILREAWEKGDARVRSEVVRLTIGWGLLSDKQIAAALASKDEWERHSALQNLNQTKFESCWPALVQMCSDPSKNIRCYLPEVLAAYPHREEAIPVLLIMSEDFDAGVKIAAAKALHTLGRKDGIPVLIQMLRNQADPASGQAGAAHRTLKDITGKELKNDEWEDWWAKNQKGNEK